LNMRTDLNPAPADSQVTHRVGLVGAGYISEFHVAALRRIRNVEIVGVFDLDNARADGLSRKAGIRAMPSINALHEAGASVIHVLTPPHTHTPVALDAIARGCHVLVEKPLSTEVADCNRIQQAAEARGVQVCVNHSLLFDPQVSRALRVAHSGKLGQIVSVDVLRSSVYPPYLGGALPPQYRSAGYPFRDLGVHALYLFEAFLGPIEDVHASWKSLGGDPNLAYDEWRAQVRCSGGLGQFQLSWNVKPLQSQIIIQGTKGVLRADLFLMFNARRASTPLPKSAERILNAMTDSLQPMVDVPRGVYGFVRKKILPYHGLQELVRAFYQSLDTGAPVPVSVEDAKRVVLWTEKVAQAADAEHELKRSAFTTSDQIPFLVTGASGKLGNAIVHGLREEGHRVRVLVRRAPESIAEGTEIALGDLGDPEAVDRAVRGAGIVIHAGAAMKGGWPEHQRGTVAGTQNVLDACEKHGVRKLVHISSMSIVDWAGAPSGEPISEDSGLEPRATERGHYTRAKLAAEELVSRAVAERRVPAIILRPGQIFGGGIPLLTGAVARRMGSRWLVLGDGEVPLPLIHMDDVVDAIIRAARSPLEKGEILQLVHRDSLTQNEVLRLAVSEQLNVLHLPRALVFGLGGFSELVLGVLHRKSPVSRYRLRSALSKRNFRSTRSHLLEGWSPAKPIVQAVREHSDSEFGHRQRPNSRLATAIAKPAPA
jgi:2-alkyl-3-oxoalkanoate reductase